MDLQPVKNQLMGLSYKEKIEISEWLHKQIDLERGTAVKEKAKEVASQMENFLNKAAEKTKVVGNSLMDQFKTATNQDNNQNTDKGPEKR